MVLLFQIRRVGGRISWWTKRNSEFIGDQQIKDFLLVFDICFHVLFWYDMLFSDWIFCWSGFYYAFLVTAISGPWDIIWFRECAGCEFPTAGAQAVLWELANYCCLGLFSFYVYSVSKLLGACCWPCSLLLVGFWLCSFGLCA